MIRRGLRQPLLVISDGTPGLIKSIEESSPGSKMQRYLFHKLSNIRNKLPEEGVDEVLPKIDGAYYQTDAEMVRMYAEKIIEEYAGVYPYAIKCFEEDFEACIQHMYFPAGHQKHITTTNLLERAFLEQKRQTKVLPRFFDEKSCLKLVYAVMVRASEKWRRIKMSSYDLTVLRNIRKLYGWEQDRNGYISREAAA